MTILAAFMGAALTGCSPKVIQSSEVPVKMVEKHDTIVVREVSRDTLIQYKEVRDSSSFQQKGDTITLEHWHWERDYQHERTLQATIDSLVSIQQDSIPYPVEVIREIEKPLKKWQTSLIGFGMLSLLVWCLMIYFRIRRR